MGRNQLSFAKIVETYGRAENSRSVEIAVPMVDGAPLFTLVEDRYPGVAMSVIAGTRHLLGQPTYAEDGVPVLLDGSCGVAGCCGAMAIIDVADDRVVWRDFFARGRPELPRGLRFEFDRASYEAAIASLPVLYEERWPVEQDESEG